MYGRCETDPFDQAIDVCDACYGEFCDNCLVSTKTRKHRICKDCALLTSGVRPGSKPPQRGERRTVAQRRKALRDAPPSPRMFAYFDEAPAEHGAGSAATAAEPVTAAVEGEAVSWLVDGMAEAAAETASGTASEEGSDQTTAGGPTGSVVAGGAPPEVDATGPTGSGDAERPAVTTGVPRSNQRPGPSDPGLSLADRLAQLEADSATAAPAEVPTATATPAEVPTATARPPAPTGTHPGSSSSTPPTGPAPTPGPAPAPAGQPTPPPALAGPPSAPTPSPDPAVPPSLAGPAGGATPPLPRRRGGAPGSPDSGSTDSGSTSRITERSVADNWRVETPPDGPAAPLPSRRRTDPATASSTDSGGDDHPSPEPAAATAATAAPVGAPLPKRRSTQPRPEA